MKGNKFLSAALALLLAGGIFSPYNTSLAAEATNEEQKDMPNESTSVTTGTDGSGESEQPDYDETNTTDAVLQGAMNAAGGFRLSDQVWYSFSYSDIRAVVVCYSSNLKPEVNSSATYNCTCKVVGKKGACKLSKQSTILDKINSANGNGTPAIEIQKGSVVKAVSFTEGGNKTETFMFETEKTIERGKDKEGKPITETVYGTASATITSNVYDGSSSLDDKNKDGGFVMPEDPPDTGFPTSTGVPPTTTGDEGGPKFFEGGPPITKDEGNPPDDGGTFPENPNGDDPPLPSDTGNNDPWDSAINSLLGDSDDSFNIADDDWASSGGWGGSDTLDDYLDGAMDGESDGYTVDDLLGLNSGVDDDASLMDLNGDGTAEGVDLDGDGNPDGTLLDTDGDGVYDAIDLNGDGKPDGWLIDEDGDGVMDGIDYNGDGVIDKYFEGHEPSSANESGGANYLNRAEEDDGLWDALMRQLSSNNRTNMAQDDSSSAKTNSRLINSLFGDDAQNIQNNTLSDQELFDLARAQLAKMGFSDKDIMNGKQYSKNSAWTEPAIAWDFNRITTLIKKKKINTSPNALNHAARQNNK